MAGDPRDTDVSATDGEGAATGGDTARRDALDPDAGQGGDTPRRDALGPDAGQGGDTPRRPDAAQRGDTPRGDRIAAAEGREAAREGHPGSPPDPIARAAAPYPWLRFLSWNRWQILAGFWVLGTVITLATDGWSGRMVFFVAMSVLFTAAAVLELRGRRRIAARRAAERDAASG